MAKVSPASRLLTQAGREVLRPLGLRQKGRSRTWLDDQGWWLILVEFQPSSWSQGSYLNVGVMWLWRESDVLSFDVGHRIHRHVGFRDEQQFNTVARDLAESAAERVRHYHGAIDGLPAAAEYLSSGAPTPSSTWHWYHAGVAAALIGDAERSRVAFKKLLEQDACDIPWMVTLQQLAVTLHALADDRDAVRSWASQTVAATR